MTKGLLRGGGGEEKRRGETERTRIGCTIHQALVVWRETRSCCAVNRRGPLRSPVPPPSDQPGSVGLRWQLVARFAAKLCFALSLSVCRCRCRRRCCFKRPHLLGAPTKPSTKQRPREPDALLNCVLCAHKCRLLLPFYHSLDSERPTIHTHTTKRWPLFS